MSKKEFLKDEFESLIELAIVNRIQTLIEYLDSDVLDLSTHLLALDEITVWKSFLREYDIPMPLELKIALLHH